MASELRALTLDDRLSHRRLMEHAFGKGRVVVPPKEDDPPPKPDDPPPKPDDMNGIWGIFDKGKLQASLSIEDYRVHWGDEATLAMGGIAGVATWADARGQGHVDALLRQSLQAMKEAGQVISALYPFSWAFYRKHGWDWVGEKWQVKLPLTELRSDTEGRKIIEVSGDGAKERLEPGYTAFARQYRGVFTTETHNWERALSHSDNRSTYAYVYEPTGEYLLWRYDRDGDGGTIREWTARTAEGYRALLSLLHYLGTQCKTAKVTLPANNPLWSHVMHWNLETKIEPVFMGRVVDVAGALNALPLLPQLPNHSLNLGIEDKQAPWNEGVWRITIEDHRVRCEPAAKNTDADVSMDIQAFSQAFWGTPSLLNLFAAGRITVVNNSDFRLLAFLLSAASVYTLDDF